jgi:hypothetical protein
MAIEMNGFKFETPQEYIAFLEGQLTSAINLLGRFEGGEAAVVERLEAQYRGHRDKLGADIAQKRERIKQMEERILANARRYDFLRQYLVQVWKIGIGATGAGLDNAIDDLLRNTPKSTMSPVESYLTEDNVMPLRK